MDVNASLINSRSMTEAPARLAADPIGVARDQWVDRGWADAALGMAAVTSIMRAQQIVSARVDAVLKPFGVTFARYEVLMLLTFSRRGSLPMKLIASRLQVHPTSVTNAVDRLVQAGLVTRTTHPDDRRAFIVALTPAGRALAQKATRVLNEQVFGQPELAPDDLESLVEIIGRMRSAAGDF